MVDPTIAGWFTLENPNNSWMMWEYPHDFHDYGNLHISISSIIIIYEEVILAANSCDLEAPWMYIPVTTKHIITQLDCIMGYVYQSQIPYCWYLLVIPKKYA